MLRFTFNVCLSLGLLGVISIAAVIGYIVPGLPDIDTLRDVKMQIPLRVYSHEHSLISEYGEKRRTPVTIDDVPPQLINAFLAAEDDRFYQHPGVDWQGILRAVVNLVKTGKKTQGGSTITMQVARNFFLSREKSYVRKLNEIFLALKIERELSKREILELYLNKIYLGQRAYGVGAASKVYYGNDIGQLDLPQLAMIAGLPKAPSTTNPVSNPQRASKRRNYVLGRMLENGYISQTEHDSAIQTAVTASLHSPKIDVEAPYVAEMVRKHMLAKYGENAYSNGYKVFTTILDKNQIAANHALRKALLEYDRRHGYRGPEHHFDLPDNSDEQTWQQLLSTFPIIGNIYPALITRINETSVIAHLPRFGQIEIDWEGFNWARKYIDANRRGAAPETAADVFQAGDIVRIFNDDAGQWQLTQIPDVEGGLVSMRPIDGATLALVGGFDFYRSKFNRITQALRQPGSSFKPFIYSAALETGHTAASLINDAPVVFDDPSIEDRWRPENYSGKYYGPTRLREALTHSRNLVSIRLLHEVGIPRGIEHIAKFGFDTDQLPHSLSLALGSGAITPWQLAAAYCVFANGGYRVEPYFIERIETYKGEIIYAANPLTVCNDCELPVTVDHTQADLPVTDKLTMQQANNNPDEATELEPTPRIADRVISPQNIWIMNSITRNVIQNGTGRRARVLNRHDLSGKTGTTNDQRDAWFSGFNASIVAVTWVGFDKFLQPLGKGETGSRAALPMWIDYMRVALEGTAESTLERPPGLVNVRIDPETGKLAKADNPKAIFEVFRAANVPRWNNPDRTPDIFMQGNKSEQIPEQLF
ncbi:MAG: penicillin-binding protein 1A [Gammaproteobacteria bacterium]|nr:penicillin-binding protein 1A [Gammaproteobacteria bacterium]